MSHNHEFSTELIIQYSIVGLILLLVCCWILWKIFRKEKKSSGGCCGCAIADTCKKAHKKTSN
ncbi:MAG: FeoB-associated Cys-rich membrane protein [Muribaculaceae bacterium]|nr:FeoB-associated Cys-rich membrane protein [Muribaculaceae bacterium]